jgi:hypothetical protein
MNRRAYFSREQEASESLWARAMRYPLGEYRPYLKGVTVESLGQRKQGEYERGGHYEDTVTEHIRLQASEINANDEVLALLDEQLAAASDRFRPIPGINGEFNYVGKGDWRQDIYAMMDKAGAWDVWEKQK